MSNIIPFPRYVKPANPVVACNMSFPDVSDWTPAPDNCANPANEPGISDALFALLDPHCRPPSSLFDKATSKMLPPDQERFFGWLVYRMACDKPKPRYYAECLLRCMEYHADVLARHNKPFNVWKDESALQPHKLGEFEYTFQPLLQACAEVLEPIIDDMEHVSYEIVLLLNRTYHNYHVKSLTIPRSYHWMNDRGIIDFERYSTHENHFRLARYCLGMSAYNVSQLYKLVIPRFLRPPKRTRAANKK